jgi:transcriptional regulator with XRE-family HTH domain
MDTFGERLRHARERRDLSQSELARAIGVKPPSISRMEGERRPTASKYVVALADALGVSAAWLADGVGEMEMEERSDPTPLRQLFADRLKLAYVQRGFRQLEHLARHAGISATRLRLLQSAHIEPTVHELIGLRAALQMTLDYLVAGVGRVEIGESEPEAVPRRLHEPEGPATPEPEGQTPKYRE